MLGINNVVVAGNVARDPMFDKTKEGMDACSFVIVINEKGSRAEDIVTWVRINMFGDVVAIVREKVKQGDYVIIRGELMNRAASEDPGKSLGARNLLEIRGRGFVALRKPRANHAVKAPAGEAEEKGAGLKGPLIPE